MIKANELRLGNIVQFGFVEKIKMVVEVIHRDGINEDISEDQDYPEADPYRQIWKFEELEPISLTPEILEMCGFEKDIHRPETMVLLVIGNLYFSSLMNNKNCIRLFSDKDAQSGEGVYIQYLHQLQNIYSALTGKELEMKSSSFA